MNSQHGRTMKLLMTQVTIQMKVLMMFHNVYLQHGPTIKVFLAQVTTQWKCPSDIFQCELPTRG